MRRYAAFAWDPRHPPATVHMDAVRRRLGEDPQWRLIEPEPGLALALEGPRCLALRQIGARAGWVLGDLYEPATWRLAGERLALPDGPELGAEALLQGFWGRYVAVWRVDAALAVLRDPSGALEAVRWRAGGVSVVATGPLGWMGALAPATAVDWGVLAQALAEPLSISEDLPLTGVSATPAGALGSGHGGAARLKQLWTPAGVVRAAAARPPEAAADQLAAVVDGCVAALAGRSGRLAAELSGGLDSSILASALCAAASEPIGWANLYGRDPESDERANARQVSAALTLRLTEIAKPEFAFTAESLAGRPCGLRPSPSALDHAYDAALSAFCADVGAETLMTGQGGDAVFLQMVTPLALLDRRWRLGAAAAFGTEALAIARGARQSVWTVLRRAALGALSSGRPPASQASPFLAAACTVASRSTHAWLTDLKGVAPSKRLHIRALAYAQLALGESGRAEVVDVVHPLLAQPIVEHCLALPVAALTAGGRGRALVRAAYQARVPRAVLTHRAKGDVTAHYGRALARSLPVLRPWLLDGVLAAQGLLDRSALEAALAPESLIGQGGYADILHLMVMERWARHWSAPMSSA
jgi:asparagine synthase (glutamine-hydrolysing)